MGTDPIEESGALVSTPIYQTTLVVNDLITAVLLFGQYAILRTRALLVLAAGYLFTAGMAGVHTLSFPGLFAPTHAPSPPPRSPVGGGAGRLAAAPDRPHHRGVE